MHNAFESSRLAKAFIDFILNTNMKFVCIGTFLSLEVEEVLFSGISIIGLLAPPLSNDTGPF